MKKTEREKLFNKYGGRCAYCGCELTKGWHVDEIDPIRRNWQYEYNEKTGMNDRKITDCMHPERLVIENQNPTCASCNINKHSMSLQQFRESIKQFVSSLNLYSTQYKLAKRYGLIKETEIEVVFYFENIYKQ